MYLVSNLCTYIRDGKILIHSFTLLVGLTSIMITVELIMESGKFLDQFNCSVIDKDYVVKVRKFLHISNKYGPYIMRNLKFNVKLYVVP